jgi:hypothetical protein
VKATRGRRIFFAVSFLLFFALLVVLIGSIGQVELAPGKRLPSLSEDDPDEKIADSGPGLRVNSKRIGSLLFALALVCLVFMVIGAVFSRHFRLSLLFMSAITLVMFLALMWLKPSEEVPLDKVEPAGSFILGKGENRSRAVLPESSPPNWAVILTAVGAAVVASGLGALLLFKIYPAIYRRRKDVTMLEELAKRASAAADQIRAGGNLADAVRRCYKEMVQLLCEKAGVSGIAVLTPREFADALRARGMQDEHVVRLTSIFEQVRYGGRPGIAFADEAIACLDAIRSAYTPSFPS